MRSVLIISERDNVATALVSLERGLRLSVKGAALTVQDPVPAGHKIALTTIAAGAAVVKYGNPIGLASVTIAAGAHVHTHNVVSVRGRGDLAPAQSEGAPRLAEPPDDRVAPEPAAADLREGTR